MSHILPIQCLRRGETAEIMEVSGSDCQIQRLGEIGFRQGSMLEVVQHGCPLIVRLRGAKYCLRGNDCSCVFVKLSNDER